MFEPTDIPRDADDERTCGNCLERKHVSEFYKDGKDADGNIKYRRDCKECYRVSRLMSRRPPTQRRRKRK